MLLDLRVESVKEQNKQQKTDGEITEKDLQSHNVKTTVKLLESFSFPDACNCKGKKQGYVASLHASIFLEKKKTL